MQTWFDTFEKVVEKYDIKTENIYNMDESGFAIGQIEATRIIVRAEARAQWQAQPGRQEWVSVLECICADGSAIPPLVIFKGEQPLCAWIPNNIAVEDRLQKALGAMALGAKHLGAGQLGIAWPAWHSAI